MRGEGLFGEVDYIVTYLVATYFPIYFWSWTIFISELFFSFSIFNSFFILKKFSHKLKFWLQLKYVLIKGGAWYLNIASKFWSLHQILFCFVGRPFYLLCFLAGICSSSCIFVSSTGHRGLLCLLERILSLSGIFSIEGSILLLNESCSSE